MKQIRELESCGRRGVLMYFIENINTQLAIETRS